MGRRKVLKKKKIYIKINKPQPLWARRQLGVAEKGLGFPGRGRLRPHGNRLRRGMRGPGTAMAAPTPSAASQLSASLFGIKLPLG